MNICWEKIDSWLQELLYERFGIVFSLQRNGFASLTLLLEEQTSQIYFDNIDVAFYDSKFATALNYTTWDAQAENLNNPLIMALPMPFFKGIQYPLIECITEKQYVIHYDILGLIYWMLTRVEEFNEASLDNHGRFPASSSHAYKNEYLDRPIVDEWFNILEQIILQIFPSIKLKQKVFTQYLSHDVDRPAKFAFVSLPKLARAIGNELFREKNIIRAIQAPYIHACSQQRISTYDPYNTFSWIMDIAEKNNLKSAFYFICGGLHELDADYSLDNPAIQHLIKNIHERGHEIGLHPSYETYLNPNALKQEFAILKKVCNQLGIEQSTWGGRMHYLRWSQEVTLAAWDNAGLNYDSTLSYADHAGFRCGTCYEYPAFNHQTQERLNLRVRPLIVMERTVFDYEGYGVTDKAYERMLLLKQRCKAMQGQFTLLWHNNSLINSKETEIFEGIISV